MSESKQPQAQKAQWTQEQWNAYVASDDFVQHYTKNGVVDAGALVKDIGLQGYLMLIEHCKHLVVYKDSIINADTREGRNLLESILKRGEISLSVLIDAGIIAGDVADDLIQNAVATANECLKPGGEWDVEDAQEAMLWAPDQWRECLRYSDFARNYVRGGVVQMGKLRKTTMPPELLERMVDRALNLIRVGDQVLDADTDEGIALLEKELVQGRVSLSKLIEAEVFTREEAIALHQTAVKFAEEHLKQGAQWTEEDRQTVLPWIPEQWDAFVDSPQFDAFVTEGWVDAQELKSLMGAEAFHTMLNKVHTLVEVGSRVAIASTAAGRAHLQDAASVGHVSLDSLVQAGIYAESDIRKKLEEARKIAQSCFREGAKWDSLSVKDAMKWSADEWDAAINGIHFAKRFVKGGVVQPDRFVGVMDTDLYRRMVDRSYYLIPLNNRIIDIRTKKGRELAEAGLWNGDVPIHTGVKMGLVSREQAANLYQEARAIAQKNFREDGIWDEEDRVAATRWSEDQWGKALEVVNISALYTEDGVVDRDRAVVAMGPDLYDAMVRHVHSFISVGSTVYDAGTKEGYKKLKEMNMLPEELS